MKMKGILAMLLCLSLAMSLAACGGSGSSGASGGTTQSTEQTVPPSQETTEPTEPDDGSVKLYYDDRLSFGELGGSETSAVEITAQEVTSKKVGAEEADEAVLYIDAENGQFIAVGVGTATVTVDGTVHLIRVRPAPISLVMITGHSIGAGQCGVEAQSVACEPGQAYSSHKTDTFQAATADMGIGYTAASKPEGIDAFMAGMGGTIGEGSALAYRWNQLTGEKIWVLNAAVGGSCINEWVQGEPFYTKAIAMYKAAAQVLTNETAAGHYAVKNTAVIYHSGANFGYKNVEYTEEIMEFWYDSMFSGYRKDLAFDHNGDGTPEPLDAIGFVSILKSTNPVGLFEKDRPYNYYYAASDAFEGVFNASEAIQEWTADNDLAAVFPAVDYETQSEPVSVPTQQAQLYAEDGTHYSQVAYNANGLVIGENLYKYLRTKVAVESVTIYDSDGIKVGDSILLGRKGASVSLVLISEPYYAGDYTITLSDGLEMRSPFTIKGKESGDQTITISKDGEVIRTITVVVPE